MGYRPKAGPRPPPPGTYRLGREPFRSLVGPPPWIMRGENQTLAAMVTVIGLALIVVLVIA